MNRYFSKTFFKFLTAFLAIISVAFVVVYVAGTWGDATPQSVDNVALPK